MGLCAMGYPIRPRQELAFWSTMHRMAERAAHQAPARDGAYKAFRLVAEDAAEKEAYWISVSSASLRHPKSKCPDRK